jgi:hypothetical protein
MLVYLQSLSGWKESMRVRVRDKNWERESENIVREHENESAAWILNRYLFKADFKIHTIAIRKTLNFSI